MRKHEMTEYDIGQVLIKAADTLAECSEELRDVHPEYSVILNQFALEIGDCFNKHGSHDFGLRGNRT